MLCWRVVELSGEAGGNDHLEIILFSDPDRGEFIKLESADPLVL